MKKVIVILTGLVILCGESWCFEPEWKEISRGLVNTKSVLIDRDNPKLIYVGTDKELLKTDDSGASWRSVLVLRGGNRTVNYLTFDMQNKNNIYAATANGLYLSENKGSRWSRIFKGKNAFESDCTAVAVLPSAIYLGTKSGLFVSKDKGRSWNKEQGKLSNSRIFNIAYLSKKLDYLYISCADGVFKSMDSGNNWERIFVKHPVEAEPSDDDTIEDSDEETRNSEIRYIAIDPNNPLDLYLATNRGVYKSKNRGSDWEALPEYGLLSRDTRFLLFSDKSELYTVSKSGIFAYRNNAWRELSLKLSVRMIDFLGIDKGVNLYACTDKGIFKSSLDNSAISEPENIITRYSKDEPGIEEIQKQAIKYAEVGPEKITAWRRQARHKAALPQVSIGAERNSSDLWHWEGGSTTKENDDYLRRGRDTVDWDVRLSWDLSELIWNNDQTSIDARSRLMVQLRDDILDEVNKLYFERIRVKMELNDLRLEERKKRFEKELRVRELTASLDALTGGYFSKHLHNQP